MGKKYFISYWVYWAVLIFITFIGFLALGFRLIEGLRITNLNSIVSWGLWISIYIFLIGVSAGSFLLSTLIYVFGFKQYEKAGKIAVLTALLSLLAGLGFVSIDLGHMERFFFIFTSPSITSILTYVIYFYFIYIVLLSLELFFLLRPKKTSLNIERDKKAVKILGIIGVPTAIIVHGGTGSVFAVVKAQHYWFSALFPLIFLVSALASGGALIAFIYAFWGNKDKDHALITTGIAKIASLVLIFDFFLILLEFLITIYGKTPDGINVINTLIKGSNWWIFWIIQILIGVIIPLVLIFSPVGRKPIISGIASLLIVIGVLGVRWNIVVPELSVPNFYNITEFFSDTRLTTLYVPTLFEWLSSIGILGFFIIVFSFFYQKIPLLDSSFNANGRNK